MYLSRNEILVDETISVEALDDRRDRTIDYIGQMHVAVDKYGKHLTPCVDETPLRSVAQNRTTIARMGTDGICQDQKGSLAMKSNNSLQYLQFRSVDGEKLKPMIIQKGKTQRCGTNLNLGNELIGAVHTQKMDG